MQRHKAANPATGKPVADASTVRPSDSEGKGSSTAVKKINEVLQSPAIPRRVRRPRNPTPAQKAAKLLAERTRVGIQKKGLEAVKTEVIELNKELNERKTLFNSQQVSLDELQLTTGLAAPKFPFTAQERAQISEIDPADLERPKKEKDYRPKGQARSQEERVAANRESQRVGRDWNTQLRVRLQSDRESITQALVKYKYWTAKQTEEIQRLRTSRIGRSPDASPSKGAVEPTFDDRSRGLSNTTNRSLTLNRNSNSAGFGLSSCSPSRPSSSGSRYSGTSKPGGASPGQVFNMSDYLTDDLV